jgi:hypothetical protein
VLDNPHRFGNHQRLQKQWKEATEKYKKKRVTDNFQAIIPLNQLEDKEVQNG